MACLTRPRRRKSDNLRPAALLVLLARQPPAQHEHSLGNLFVSPATAMAFDECCRRLPECAGMDLHRQAIDPAIIVELNGKANAASARRRTNFRLAVMPIERMRFLERGRETQDLGRVEGLAHRLVHSRRQVVPSGPSSKTIPSPFS